MTNLLVRRRNVGEKQLSDERQIVADQLFQTIRRGDEGAEQQNTIGKSGENAAIAVLRGVDRAGGDEGSGRVGV